MFAKISIPDTVRVAQIKFSRKILTELCSAKRGKFGCSTKKRASEPNCVSLHRMADYLNFIK